MATHSNILAWKIPWTEELAGYSPCGSTESDMTKWLNNNKSSILAFLNSVSPCSKLSNRGVVLGIPKLAVGI